MRLDKFVPPLPDLIQHNPTPTPILEGEQQPNIEIPMLERLTFPTPNSTLENIDLIGGSVFGNDLLDEPHYFSITHAFTPVLRSTARVSRIAHSMLNGDEIAEIFQSEAGFTIATDKKPIVATFGCSPCVALGGYDATNKIAFVAHFAHAREVRECGHKIFYYISKLAKEKIDTPIQLHIRGGYIHNSHSDDTREAIKVWMKQRKDLPMKIVSDISAKNCQNLDETSLLIDSRTGSVAGYDPTSNSNARKFGIAQEIHTLLSVSHPNIEIAYTPDN